jgi:hypothetical protein
MVEVDSQAVLNTLTAHDFQDAVKHGRSAGNGAYKHKVTTSRVTVVSRSKLHSDQMAVASSPTVTI